MPFTVSINNNVFGGGEASSLDQKECSKENGLFDHRVLVTSLWLLVTLLAKVFRRRGGELSYRHGPYTA
jgi:hypothetical protein